MGSNKVKFKVSIKELVFEYEGDNERARVLQGRISETLESLAAAQADAIDITPARQLPAPATATQQPQLRRRRRTRRTAVSGNGSSVTPSENGDNVVDEEVDGKAPRKQRARGTSYRAQVTKLLNEGFFSTKRTTETVHAELVRRGHTFEPGRITDALVNLTQRQKLDRTATAAGDWEYEARANDCR